MNIVILDDYQDAVRKLECAARLDGCSIKVYTNTIKGVGQLAVRLRDAEVIVLLGDRTHITQQLLSKLPKLRLIAQVGEIGPHIDVQACTDRRIAITTGSECPFATAELTWALIMAAMRRLPQYIAHLKHGAWQQSGFKAASMPANFALGNGLRGRTLGIWGYGKIGKIVAGYGRAFGMHVCIWGSAASRAAAQQDGLSVTESPEALFSTSDVLSLHLRLSPSTRHIVQAQHLALMKPSALLVNTAHAELIEGDALANALQQGRPGLAAVDVYENEPILQGHTLLRMENCICTPHLGFVEQDSYEKHLGMAFDNIVNFMRGRPSHILNPQAL